ncbi:MAG: flagellar transcriptional regulator FlhC [Rhodocyclaceae bacterium]|nr:flagellar transcriptional regulator FlhC [Rhodocyclaceae bacterium]
MRNKSVVAEAQQIGLAIELIQLGARLQVLEAETSLSRERLSKLYKEIRGVSPPKGMLPFSADWFMTWQPNIHASLFMAFSTFLREHAGLAGLDNVIKAYSMYRQHVMLYGMDQVLSLTRAWTLLRFIDAQIVQLVACKRCGGHFVAHAYQPSSRYVCGLCNVPARAGKVRQPKGIAIPA